MRPPLIVKSSKPTTLCQVRPRTQLSRDSSWLSAYAAPTKAPIDVPQTMSGAMPASSSTRIIPICDQPRADPLPRASPILGFVSRMAVLFDDPEDLDDNSPI